MAIVTKEEREKRKIIERKFGGSTELAAVLASVYPQSAEREMKRYLKRYTRELKKIVKEADDKIASGKPKKAVLRHAKKEIEQLSLKYNPSREIGKISQQVTNIEEAQFRKSLKKTVGVDMPQFDKDTFKDEQDDWTIGTLGLIGLFLLGVNQKLDKAAGEDVEKKKDTPKITVGGVEAERREKKVEKPVEMTRDQIRKELRKISAEADDIGEIARNRVGDLMAGVNTKIYGMFGIKRNVWRTRRDAKVRDCHKSFDGHIFRVDQPPEIWYGTKHGRVYTGRHCHPGEDYNCRCRAIPLFTREAVYTILTREKWKKELEAK